MSDESKTSHNPLSDFQWVVFGPDWGRHPSSSQHLFSEFLGVSPVLWVETVGLRMPQFTMRDLRRSVQKIVDFISGRRRRFATVPNGLTVICPPTLPFTSFKFIRHLNVWLVRRSVEKATRRLHFSKHTLVVTTPAQGDFVGRLGEEKSIYYCADQYALWPGMNQQHISQMERLLTDRVDAIVAVSDLLAAQFQQSGKPLYTLNQGVNSVHFSRSQPQQSTGHFEIVYFGMIDERLDLDLILEVAHQLPKTVIRLIGPATVSLHKFVGVANIRVEPAIPYEDLPESLKTSNLFIIPFVLTELACSCSPLKIKEYLACARPVISTALPEAERLSSFVHVAKDRKAFVEAVTAATEGKLSFDVLGTQRFIESETWQAKAVEFGQFVRGLHA
ncbi:MAG: glycosyltransferase [Prosthecobacter sp.]|uniref:glycosyltransferase n=1 Tax=Prosthecobacter sp. TaxID=1965333 RepID=UPI003BAFADF4